MLNLVDVKTDNADDIIIDGDLSLDNFESAVVKTAGRRLVARWDDFQLDDIAAGLERWIYSTQTPITKENIRVAMYDVLISTKLLSSRDFKIVIQDKESRVLSAQVIFTAPYLNAEPFRIIVDQENQRIYRG